MIDPITNYIIESNRITEGYCLKCAMCGRVVTIKRDGQGPLNGEGPLSTGGALACCNKRMIVVSSTPEDPEESEDSEEQSEGVRKALKGEVVEPDFQVPVKSANFTPDNQSEVQKKVSEETEFIRKIRSEAGFDKKPKGWDKDSIKKFGKTLIKGGATKEDFFEKCVEKMKGKMENPEGFCASVKDEAHGSTYWRGKGKTPQQAGKDVKKHQNV